jgi:hypothetical protein
VSRPRPLEWLRWPRSWFRTRDSTPDPRPGEDEEWTDKEDPYPRVRNGHGREPVDEDGRTP